jgi:hypothetical protein
MCADRGRSSAATRKVIVRARLLPSRLAAVVALLLALAAVQSALASEVPPVRLGLTHGQHSINPWESPEAVARARALLASHPGTFQAQHIMGWGAGNPEPIPGQHDWRSLDRRIRLIRDTAGTPVITLCCAPDWMKGGVPGLTDWARLEVAPLRLHYDAFAELAAAVARRYPDVLHFQVWNEMKGFWDPLRNRWRYEDYTDLYNRVYRALKAVNPAIQVGGPYVHLTSLQPDVGGGRDSEVRGDWGMVDQRALDVLDHWLDHAAGADFVVVDGSAALRDGTFRVPPIESAEKLVAVAEWLRARTSLPIWWSEVAPVPYTTSSSYAVSDQQAQWRATIDALERGGVSVGLLWQPESNARHTGLWTSVASADGGQPTPVYDVIEPWLR